MDNFFKAKLTNRQSDILIYLMENQNDGFLSLSEIADRFDLSSKTIYREIKDIKSKSNEDKLSFISKEGNGIRLLCDNQDDLRVRLLNNKTPNIQSRMIDVLIDLLKISPKKITYDKLSEKYYVSSTSIAKDIKEIEDKIKRFNLKIESDKNGTSIVGQEEDIRKAIIYLITHKYDVVKKDYYSEKDKEENLFNAFIDGYDKELMSKVKGIIDKTQKSLGYTLENPYYINLITHILILIQRIKNGNCIENNNEFIDKVNIHYFRIANEISSEISKIIGGEQLNDSELFFIYQYLVSCGTSNDISNANIDKELMGISKEIIDYANDVIDEIKKELNYDIKSDKRISNLLLLHLNAMIKRCKFNIVVKNELLDQIKENYSEDFDIITKIIREKCAEHFNNLKISDDEISYVVLYAQSIKNNKNEHLNVVIVCSCGVGTSNLIRNKIEGKYPSWNIVHQLPQQELSKTSLDDIDLVISTVTIHEKIDVPVVYTSVFLNETDVKNINRVLNERGKA